MYDLLRFLFQNSSFLVFLVLEFISITLVINYNDHQNTIINEATTNLTGYLESRNSQVREYLELKKEKSDLIKENERLTKELYDLKENYRLDTSSIFKSTPITYDVITAKVVSKSISRANNMMIMDQGANEGIEIGNGVVSDNSVVGVISDVRPKYSQCISILNSRIKVVCEIEELNAFGTVTWEPYDDRFVVMNDIPKHYPVKEGQHVITSKFSSVFPAGLEIGTVENVASRPGRNDLEIKIRLEKSPYEVSLVQIIKPLNKPDFDED